MNRLSKSFHTVAITLLLQSCGKIGPAPENGGSNAGGNAPSVAFTTLEALSERLYEGGGSWADRAAGYRSLLRSVYWRVDVYQALARSSRPQSEKARFATRAAQGVQFLLEAQTQGGNSVFGIPADPRLPEFGDDIQSLISICPACSVNGWVVRMPSPSQTPELYYDHGYSLSTIANYGLENPSSAILDAVHRGANWALTQPVTSNINYLSALAKGLARAYLLTRNTAYLSRAIELHRDYILPAQDAAGEWSDAHNDRLEYHSFIVSGMVALRSVLAGNESILPSLESALRLALTRMAVRNQTETAPELRSTWMSASARTWWELSRLRRLSSDEISGWNACQKWMERDMGVFTLHTPPSYANLKLMYLHFSLGYRELYEDPEK